MSKILVILGTRPEAIKCACVIEEMRELGLEVSVLLTGQHWSLMEGMPDLGEAESLDLPSDGTISPWLTKAKDAIHARIESEEPKFVMVQGDTMSAYAGALAASEFVETVLLHVEAGVRSFDEENPWPEETFRKHISILAGFHYATTSVNVQNLLNDHIQENRIILTGSPVVSAIARFTKAARVPVPKSQIIITLHRRELINGEHCKEILVAIVDTARVAEDVDFLWPMHPHFKRNLSLLNADIPENLLVVEPLGYAEMVEELSESMGILTDSGGLQEEAATLGVPCAVLRKSCDRPESVRAGLAEVYDPEPTACRVALEDLLAGVITREAKNIYGDWRAARKIAEHVNSLVELNKE